MFRSSRAHTTLITLLPSLFLGTAMSLAAPQFARGAGVADAPSASPKLDEVKLNSGGFIRGEVLEYIPGDYVVIQPASGGEPRRYPWSDVSSVTLAETEASTEEAPPDSEETPPEPSSLPDAPPPDPEPDEPEPDEHSSSVSSPPPSSERPAPLINITMPPGSKPMILNHIDGEAIGTSAAGTVHAISYSEVCRSPCISRVEDWQGDYFLSGKGYRPSKRFRLEGHPNSYKLEVNPKPAYVGGLGWALVALSIPVTTLFMFIPDLNEMPKSSARGFYVTGGILGAAMFGGGLTLTFGRTKVKVSVGL